MHVKTFNEATKASRECIPTPEQRRKFEKAQAVAEYFYENTEIYKDKNTNINTKEFGVRVDISNRKFRCKNYNGYLYTCNEKS